MPPETTLLAFDTSAAHCAAALMMDGHIVAARIEPMEKGQAERLIPLLELVLADGGVDWHDLAALAVGIGPGNFTGIRIAVSAARGLALGLGIPAIGITQFEALATGQPHPVLVVEDARRGSVYVQGFGIAPAQAVLMGLAEARGLVAQSSAAVSFVGSGMPLVAPPHETNLPAPSQTAIAQVIAHAAWSRLGTPQPRPAPFYLRAADAAPPSDPPPVILDALA